MDEFKFQQRAVVRFLTLEGVPPHQILDRLQEVLHHDAFSNTEVNFWAAETKRGRESVFDKERLRRRRRSLLHADTLRDVLGFFGVLQLLRLASVSWFFFERFLKHRDRERRLSYFGLVCLKPGKHLRVFRGSLHETPNMGYGKGTLVPLKYIFPPEDITKISEVRLIVDDQQSFFIEEMIPFFRRVFLTSKKHNFIVTLRPSSQVLELINEAFERFQFVMFCNYLCEGAEDIIRLPCIQNSHNIEVWRYLTYEKIMPLTEALIEWLHFDSAKYSEPKKRTLWISLTSFTIEEQYEYLFMFWRLLNEVYIKVKFKKMLKKQAITDLFCSLTNS